MMMPRLPVSLFCVAHAFLTLIAAPVFSADPPVNAPNLDPFGNPRTPQGFADPFGNPSSSRGSADPFASESAVTPATGNADPFAWPDAKANRHSNAANPFATAGDVGGDPFAGAVAQSASEAPRLQSWCGTTRESMERFETALNSKTSLTFVEETLDKVLRDLSTRHGIPLRIDVRALEEIGLSSDVPVSLEVQAISLRSALRLMLRDLDLTYVIDNEVLQVTTHESAKARLAIAIYRLDDTGMDAEDGQALIRKMVQPETWSSAGGVATITALSNATKGEEMLVVSASDEIHRAILDLLKSIAAQHATNLRSVGNN